MTGSPLRTAFKALTAGLALSLFLWITLVPLHERDTRVTQTPTPDPEDRRDPPRVARLGELPQARIVGIESEPDPFAEPTPTAPRHTLVQFDPPFDSAFDTASTLDLPTLTVSTDDATPRIPAFPERISEAEADPFAAPGEPIPILELPPIAVGTPDAGSPFELPELEAPTTAPPDLPLLDPFADPAPRIEIPLVAPRPVEFTKSVAIEILPVVPDDEPASRATLSTIEIARGNQITRVEVPANRPPQIDASRTNRDVFDALEQTRRENDELRDSSRQLQRQVDGLHAEQRRTLERLESLQRRLDDPEPKHEASPSRTVSLPQIEPRPPEGVNEPFAAPPPPPVEHREATAAERSAPPSTPELPVPGPPLATNNPPASVPVWFDDELSRHVAMPNGTTAPVDTLTEFPCETCDEPERRGLLHKLGSLRLGWNGSGWLSKSRNRCDCPSCRMRNEMVPEATILGMPGGAVLLPPLDPGAAKVR